MKGVKKFDLIVIGSGSGLDVAGAASELGWNVAIIEKGAMGGTCLNRGCIPSKILIHVADIAQMINRADDFGLKGARFKPDFKRIVSSTSKTVDTDSRDIKRGVKQMPKMTLYHATGQFVGPKILKVGNERITAKKIIVAAGARPNIAPIPGIKDAPVLTSAEGLRLEKQPEHLVVIGGGYIGCELAHFYGSLGTKITIIQRNKWLMPREDVDVRDVLTSNYSKRFRVLLEHDTTNISYKNKTFTTTVRSRSGRVSKIKSDQVLVATGVRPNTDTLDVTTAGIKMTKRGYVKVNRFLETNVPGVYAFGDIIGKYQFKHIANHEAQYVFYNAVQGKKVAVDYRVIPYAVFGSPQIAGVGLMAEQAKALGKDVLVGKYLFKDTAMGEAMHDEDGFVKVVVDKKTRKIIGCQIIGPEASTLIHEIILAMTLRATVDDVLRTIHVHPALSEVIQRACASVQ